MTDACESLPPLAGMRDVFAAQYRANVTFEEDASLVQLLESEAETVLSALAEALGPKADPESLPVADLDFQLHDAYSLVLLLARKAGVSGGTPNTALALAAALAAALERLCQVPDPIRRKIAIVALEGYCEGRDDRITAELRRSAAAAQAVSLLAPRCLTVSLGGRHAAHDLAPTLDEAARELLRVDARSCVLDLRRLEPPDEELSRAIGQLCSQASTLGVATFVVGASPSLRAQFERWRVVGGGCTVVDDRARAQELALAAAGYELRRIRPWVRLLHRGRRAAT